MPILLFIIALALHLFLDLPIWASVLIVGGGHTVMALLGRHLLHIPNPFPIHMILIGAIFGMVMTYVPMVIGFYLSGNPSR